MFLPLEYILLFLFPKIYCKCGKIYFCHRIQLWRSVLFHMVRVSMYGSHPLYRLTLPAELNRSWTGSSNLVTQGWLQERYGFKHLTESFCLRSGRPAGMREATGHETGQQTSGHICQQEQLMCNNAAFQYVLTFHTATVVDQQLDISSTNSSLVLKYMQSIFVNHWFFQ